MTDQQRKTALAQACGLSVERLVSFEIIAVPGKMLSVQAKYIVGDEQAEEVIKLIGEAQGGKS